MNDKKKRFFFLFIFLVLPLTSVFAQLVHPGISHSMSDLERIKAMVEAGEEPWASEFANFSSNSKSLCSYTVKGDTSITEITNHSDFQNDGYAAYYNALMWYITGDECHAEKAVEIFNSWVNVTNTTGIPLNQGRGPWKMCEGAEIIKHTYDGWSIADQQKFADMLVYPGYSTTTVPTGNKTFYWNLYQGDPGRYGNQGLFAYRSLMAMAIFLDNEIMYDRALRYLQGLPHRADDLAYPSGPPDLNTNTPYNDCEYIEERNSTGRLNTIEDYGYNEVISNYIYENGQCQESARDQVHSSVGIQIIACMAEMAWNQGDNLYGHLDNRLLKGIEFFFRYNVGADQFSAYGHPDWNPTVASGEFLERWDRTGRFLAKKINPHVVCDYTRDSRGEDVLDPWYEMVLGHYRDRINLPSNNYEWTLKGLEIYQDVIGFEGEHRPSEFHGWGGLKFHRVSPGDPISGFDLNGLPVFKMNDLTATIEAENYDYLPIDGEGLVYSDDDINNSGGEYRTTESVDIEAKSGGGYNITSIKSGEWLTYTIAVPERATYSIAINYAASQSGATMKFAFNEEEKTTDLQVPFGAPNSTGETDWKSYIIAEDIVLNQGVQSLKIMFNGTSDAFKLDSFSINKTGITKSDQTIQFFTISDKVVGGADFNPEATASSGLDVSYSSSNPSVATIVGGKVHIVGTGITTITANQSGNELYYPAPSVSQQLRVVEAVAGTLNLDVEADAYVHLSNVNTNYGAATVLVTKGEGRYAYLKFDLSSVPGTIISAKLRIYQRTGFSQVRTVYDVADDSWTETGITWANKPDYNNQRSSATTTSTWSEWDVSSYVAQEYNGDKTITFVVKDDNNNSSGIDFRSKEFDPTLVPELIVEYASEPLSINAVEQSLKLYPNPVNIEFSLRDCMGSNLSVFNLLGKQVLSVDIKKNEETIDVSNLTSGVYFVQVKNNEKVITKKIVKK
ncbi:DNRLRE domain-containing protein [Seonamhaeicola sp. NFXS20]|uniref:CBM96 family carbohydrate-binding protein n=1 Tax=Seonamhaeicola sp. NFXS20 TaxID=2816959 RepID=UPI003B8E319F